MAVGGVRRAGRDGVVLCGRQRPPVWGLPNGRPKPGKTSEQTAIREVGAETGLQVRIEEIMDSIEY